MLLEYHECGCASTCTYVKGHGESPTNTVPEGPKLEPVRTREMIPSVGPVRGANDEISGAPYV